jgi:hypothetical protein
LPKGEFSGVERRTIVSSWYDRTRFLWEEEVVSPEEVPRAHREEHAGVPRSVRRATRFALIGVVASSLMAQIIGIRLISPVDAAPNYYEQCLDEMCRDKGIAPGKCAAFCRANSPQPFGHFHNPDFKNNPK